jgi:hypothetical protein
VLKQFDDLLVKILIVAAVVDLVIALASGETGLGAFVEPSVIVLILVANGALPSPLSLSSALSVLFGCFSSLFCCFTCACVF